MASNTCIQTNLNVTKSRNDGSKKTIGILGNKTQGQGFVPSEMKLLK